ncbi:hypothetical protein UFOVP49_162 [uncultured Caudovirales phage]|uniref:Uncharacterized protein n=1 Tax=uncultured Caudovirales phage TaxID=2100421 RepID=A0A6J5KPN5_9CAUD|nr:hypothetical protein UFOVP49_162 [uncultured Caudovirales phage]
MNNFDVEQGILDCWHITDDLKILAEGVLDGNLNNDDVANVLIGLQALYQLKFDKLFQTHEANIRNQPNTFEFGLGRGRYDTF